MTRKTTNLPFIPAAGLFLLNASGDASGAPPREACRDPALSVREHLLEMVEEDELPGVQYVAVDARGALIDVALGVRDVVTQAEVEPTTLQMAYSMTKAITALSVMKLVDAGTMQLDEPLSTYYAAHPYGHGVTIRSLLAQTAGVPNPMPLDWFSVEGSPFERDEKLAALLRKHGTLAHPPGTRYRYSNLSYWLLEKAIEAASGTDYAEYVEQNLLRPLSIRPDEARFSPGKPAESATGHSRRYTPMNLFIQCISPREYWSEASGSWSRTARVVPHGRGYGGLFTTASALAEVLRALLNEESPLLSKEARETMFTQQSTTKGKPIDMTLGWVIGEVDGVRYFGKQGGGLGYSGNLRIYPDRGLATAMLTNRTELSPGPIDARSDELDSYFLSAR